MQIKNKEKELFKNCNVLQFKFKGKLIEAEVIGEDREYKEWVILFGKDVGSSWFRAFKKNWLLKNAVLIGECNE